MKTIELLQALSDDNVQYVLVGGLAVQLHGFMRATFDIDLVLAMDDGNLARFIEVAKRFGLKPGIPVPIDSLRNAGQIEQWHREKDMLTFTLREPQAAGSVVDVLVRPEISFETLMANAVKGALFGRRVLIASVDDLLAMKRVANRSKDQLDIVALEKIKRGEDPNA
ncbi:MAG: nucleotidyl transferase AbiEii/AbiGii toxin family protein [Sterolibacterium sp.]